MAKNPATAGLTAAIAAGDEQAFAAFYDAWFDAACAMARALTRRDEAFCLDVVQDVMVRVVDRLPPLGSEDAVAAWMATAVRRAALDHLRAERRQRRRDGIAGARVGGSEDEDTAAVLLAAERRDWVDRQVARLDPAEQRLLRARFGRDDTVAAAGAALGLSADAAHGRLRRLLERLRRAALAWIDG